MSLNKIAVGFFNRQAVWSRADEARTKANKSANDPRAVYENNDSAIKKAIDSNSRVKKIEANESNHARRKFARQKKELSKGLSGVTKGIEKKVSGLKSIFRGAGKVVPALAKAI